MSLITDEIMADAGSSGVKVSPVYTYVSNADSSSTGLSLLEVVLATITINADTFDDDGDFITLECYFTSALITSSKTTIIRVDGVDAFTNTNSGTNINRGVGFTAIRSNSGQLKCFGYRVGQTDREYTEVGGIDFTSDFDIEIVGQTNNILSPVQLEYYFTKIGGM